MLAARRQKKGTEVTSGAPHGGIMDLPHRKPGLHSPLRHSPVSLVVAPLLLLLGGIEVTSAELVYKNVCRLNTITSRPQECRRTWRQCGRRGDGMSSCARVCARGSGADNDGMSFPTRARACVCVCVWCRRRRRHDLISLSSLLDVCTGCVLLQTRLFCCKAQRTSCEDNYWLSPTHVDNTERDNTCVQQQACGWGEYYVQTAGMVLGILGKPGTGPKEPRKCNACPSDTYQDSPYHREGNCKPHTKCEDTGQRRDGASPRAAGTCEHCGVGKYQDATGHEEETCKDQATCGPGERLDGASASAAGSCRTCGEGKYQDAASGHRENTCKDHPECSAGEHIDGRSSTTSGSCPVCQAGTYSATKNRITCTPCEADTYSATPSTRGEFHTLCDF